MTTPQNIHRMHTSYNNNTTQQHLHSAASDKRGHDSVTNSSSPFSGSGKQQQHSSPVTGENTRPSTAALTMSSIAQQVDEIENNQASDLKAAEEDLNIFVKQLLEQMVLLVTYSFPRFHFCCLIVHFVSLPRYLFLIFSCLPPFDFISNRNSLI